jgi:hypothetical protein
MLQPANPGDPAPSDLPDVEVPAPDFLTVGKQLETGKRAAGQDTGFWESLWSGIKAVFTWCVTMIYKAAYAIAAFLAEVILKGDEGNDAKLGEIAALALSNLMGVAVSAPALAGLSAGKANERKAVAKQVGDAILNAVTSIGAGVTKLEPGKTAAENYLYMVTHMAIEGWMTEWISDACSAHLLERFGGLKESLNRMLALGRLTRIVVKPAIDIVVGTPFTWLLNKTYRPTNLGAGDAWRQFVRGKWTQAQMEEELARQGLDSERMEAVLTSHRKLYSDTDLDYMVAHGFCTLDEAIASLKDQGWEEPVARMQLALSGDRRLDTYRHSMASELMAAYASYDIDDAQFTSLLLIRP